VRQVPSRPPAATRVTNNGRQFFPALSYVAGNTLIRTKCGDETRSAAGGRDGTCRTARRGLHVADGLSLCNRITLMRPCVVESPAEGRRQRRGGAN